MFVFMVGNYDSDWIYAHEDPMCVFQHIANNFGGWFEEYNEETYEEIGFDWRNPYDNDLDIWNKFLEGFYSKIYHIIESDDVFDETKVDEIVPRKSKTFAK